MDIQTRLRHALSLALRDSSLASHLLELIVSQSSPSQDKAATDQVDTTKFATKSDLGKLRAEIASLTSKVDALQKSVSPPASVTPKPVAAPSGS